MSRLLQLVVAVTLLGCRHAEPRDPSSVARLLVRKLATLALAHDIAGLQRELAPGAARVNAPALTDAEWGRTAERLRSAADGFALVAAHARLRGALGLEIALVHTAQGWRVEPESLAMSVPTPVAAIERLVLALDRLESDAALTLLGANLRDSMLSAARERVRGLRELLPRVPSAGTMRIAMQLDYGQGLFVLLKHEADGWRIDDFN